MTPPPARRSLSVRRIVDEACLIIERDGLSALSMRRLAAQLGVDPMAIYHHVADKRAILGLVTARILDDMVAPDPAASWDVRVRQWATGYWELVVANRDLTIAGLADPAIAAGGRPATELLVAAIADSGVHPDLVEPIAFIVVDAVHGSALGAGTRPDSDDHGGLRAAFAIGLDTILAGIVARVDERPA